MEMYACVKDGKEHEQNAKCAYQTNVMTTMMMKYIEKEAEQKPIDAYQANKFSIQRMRIFSFLAHAAKLFYELFEVVCEFFCCFFSRIGDLPPTHDNIAFFVFVHRFESWLLFSMLFCYDVYEKRKKIRITAHQKIELVCGNKLM